MSKNYKDELLLYIVEKMVDNLRDKQEINYLSIIQGCTKFIENNENVDYALFLTTMKNIWNEENYGIAQPEYIQTFTTLLNPPSENPREFLTNLHKKYKESITKKE